MTVARGGVFVAQSGLPFGGVPSGGRVGRAYAHGGRELVGRGFGPPFGAGVNVETDDPREVGGGGTVSTGAFLPFGVASTPGQRIPGAVPCTAAVMRCNPDGSA